MFGDRKGLPDWARVENHAVRGIEYGHTAVHDDAYCKANDYFDDLDTSATRDYYIKPADGLELHIDNLQLEPTAGAIVEIYRNPVVTAPGTAVLHHRLNGWSAKNIICVYHTPTITSVGTLAEKERINGSTTNQASTRIGGASSSGEEIIVPGKGSLLIRVTGLATDTTITFRAGYYEVSNGSTRPEA